MSNQNQQNQGSGERNKENKESHNFKDNPERAREAGRKGGEQSHGRRDEQ